MPCLLSDIRARVGAAPDIVFGNVDTEAQQELATNFRITSIPTLMAFRDGIGVFSQVGALPGSAFEQLITGVRELDMEEVRKKAAEQSRAERGSR